MNYSSYFSKNFDKLEQKELSLVKGLQRSNTANDVDIIITSSDTIPATIPKSAKLIIHPNSGYDKFDLNWLKDRDIPVIVGSPIRQVAVSEYYLSCIFHHFSPLPIKKEWDEGRQWKRKLLKDQKVLIYGFGHIGQYLEKALINLTKEVTISDPFKKPKNEIRDLENYDIVISAFGLNESTRDFFSSDFFSNCKSDVLFLHASRGRQINIDSLKSFLAKNNNATAYVDVFPEEPYDLASIDLPNLHCSCHIAGVYEKIEENLIEFEKEVLVDYISKTLEDFKLKYKEQNLNERKDHSFLI